MTSRSASDPQNLASEIFSPGLLALSLSVSARHVHLAHAVGFAPGGSLSVCSNLHRRGELARSGPTLLASTAQDTPAFPSGYEEVVLEAGGQETEGANADEDEQRRQVLRRRC